MFKLIKRLLACVVLIFIGTCAIAIIAVIKSPPLRSQSTTAETPDSTPAPTPHVPKRVVSDADAKAALEVIKELQKADAFGRLDLANHTVTVMVKTQWYLASFDQKKSFTNAVLVWGASTDGDVDAVLYLDNRTNKTVATYSDWSGFEVK